MKFIKHNGRLIPCKNYLITTDELPDHDIIDQKGIFVICRDRLTNELFFYSPHKPFVYEGE